jgi:hypothetical protein
MENKSMNRVLLHSFVEFFSAPTVLLDGSDIVVGSNTTGRVELDRGSLLNQDACGRLHLTSPTGDQTMTMTLLSVRQ